MRNPARASKLRVHSGNRIPRQLPHRLDRRLMAYTVAAGAAATGLLAATPARADIIFTPAHTALTNGTLLIDLNHDGIGDFTLSNLGTVGDRKLTALGALGNGILHTSTIGSSGAIALRAGSRIGSPRFLFTNDATLANAVTAFGGTHNLYGQWANVRDRFLGLAFQINGQTHYGWAELTVRAGFSGSSPLITALLQGYAYDTVANQALRAGQKGPADAPGTPTPEPGTLALLALGSLGLGLWRRRKQESRDRTQESE